MRIVLFGTGNMATRLGMALRAKNAEIVQVYGRTGSSASLLAEKLGCLHTTSLSEIDTSAELYSYSFLCTLLSIQTSRTVKMT